MRRREFLAILAGAPAAWPLAADGQQSNRAAGGRLVGVLLTYPTDSPQGQKRVAAFAKGLTDAGWVRGRDYSMELRWASPQDDFIRTAAAELISLAPDVILVYSTAAAKELQRQTSRIPIVFVQASDPVGNRLADSLAHPGANITGLTNFEFSIGSKWVPMFKQVAPSLNRIAVLFNPKTAARGGMVWVNPIAEVGTTLNINTVPMPAYDAAEIAGLVDAFAREPNGGLMAAPDAFTSGNYAAIVATAAKNRLPALYPFRFFVESGGLMSYGPDEDAMFEQTAYYVNKILRGEKPGDLPIQAPNRLDLVINLKTAKTLGLEVPANLLALANDVIE
jgi:ABC-type uncharacterized transport system substrate-binding protein